MPTGTPSFPIPVADAADLATAISEATGTTVTGTDVKNAFDPRNNAQMLAYLEALASYIRTHH